MVPAKEADSPGGILKGVSCAAPPICAIESLEPISQKKLNAKTIIFDLGQNCSMMPRLSVSGARGSFVSTLSRRILLICKHCRIHQVVYLTASKTASSGVLTE
jgi:hypothetical protein